MLIKYYIKYSWFIFFYIFYLENSLQIRDTQIAIEAINKWILSREEVVPNLRWDEPGFPLPNILLRKKEIRRASQHQ